MTTEEYLHLSPKEHEKLVLAALRDSNKMQLDMVARYEKKFGPDKRSRFLKKALR